MAEINLEEVKKQAADAVVKVELASRRDELWKIQTHLMARQGGSDEWSTWWNKITDHLNEDIAKRLKELDG